MISSLLINSRIKSFLFALLLINFLTFPQGRSLTVQEQLSNRNSLIDISIFYSKKSSQGYYKRNGIYFFITFGLFEFSHFGNYALFLDFHSMIQPKRILAWLSSNPQQQFSISKLPKPNTSNSLDVEYFWPSTSKAANDSMKLSIFVINDSDDLVQVLDGVKHILMYENTYINI